ncbi:hypothetical protein B0H17DRAFT_959854 [Mycena rosella]|uniref:Uncharacterized protein n=1 Tax=Mycena rosella TaxID=1033263 RepID=A0AAD7FXA1_MYCRO|nr:hypothetical protein B0H17DRAFT_959854 [Mycena rosella]
MSGASPSSTVIPGPNIILGRSASKDLPPPYVDSPIFAQRAETGLYDEIADQIAQMNTEALANIDYPDHFTRVIEEWSHNHKYMDKEGNELRVAIVGEVVGPAHGTILRAHGNYFSRYGDDFKPIDDKSKIKDTLALCAPTCATTKMSNTFLNQLNTLGQVTDADTDKDIRKGNVCHSIFPREGVQNHDIIVTHMLPKYGVPPKPKRMAKRKLDEVDEEAAAPVALVLPSGDNIKFGAHYEPTLLEDYGGLYFNHVKAKLVQLDVRDTQNDLIGPWKFYDALKPGTLVLVLASLHCFVMSDEKSKRERKVYQINAHSVCVLAESDQPVEKRTRPIAPNDSAPLPDRPSTSSVAFSAFRVPVIPAADPMESDNDSVVGKTSSRGKGKRAKRD